MRVAEETGTSAAPPLERRYLGPTPPQGGVSLYGTQMVVNTTFREFKPPHGCHVVRMAKSHPRYDAKLPYLTTQPHFYKSNHVEVHVPEGFAFDFASVPRPFWWLFPRDGDYMRAAMFHDKLYRDQYVSRMFADAIFMDIMKHDGVPWYHRLPIYYAVRAFGCKAWDNIKKAK